ncbi:MAG: hypothetical protein AAF466_05755 [Bacteroidota bacterium]
MRKRIFSFLLVASLLCGATASAADHDNWNLSGTEQIYVHVNGTLFLTGEYMYYTVYCLDRAKGVLSQQSKIAYIELIGKDQKAVFKQKIALDKGVGRADFFIPNRVGSGSYKLIAYTMGMKPMGLEHFYQQDIRIINPYLGDQSSIVSETAAMGGVKAEVDSEKTKKQEVAATPGTNQFELLMETDTFRRRSEVEVALRNNINLNGLGRYSMSVRRLDQLPEKAPRSSVDVVTGSDRKNVMGSPNLFSIEKEGSIVSGTLISKVSDRTVGGRDVALSIPGKNFYFKVDTASEDGTFRFYIDPNLQSESAYVQVMGEGKEDFLIVMDQTDDLDYRSLSFDAFQIDPSMESTIVNRSIQNQIENAYFEAKPDTVKEQVPDKPFIYYEKKLRYDLDEYTRFNTVEEVFQEIVKLVWTARDKDGERFVRVYKNEFSEPTRDPALVFVDGVFIQDHSDVLDMNADQIQHVTVVRNAYRFGGTDYQGVVLLETKTGGYAYPPNSYTLQLSPVNCEQRKDYFQQGYDSAGRETDHRIPDFRTQLYWNPEIVLTKGEERFSFFTSDATGLYEIALEGFTNDGQPVSLRKRIRVID